MMSKTQNDAILAHLRTGRAISPLEALETYGCFRLGARIFDLKRKGIAIASERVTDPKSGKSYAKYQLAAR